MVIEVVTTRNHVKILQASIKVKSTLIRGYGHHKTIMLKTNIKKLPYLLSDLHAKMIFFQIGDKLLLHSTNGNIRPALHIFAMALGYLKGKVLEVLKLQLKRYLS